MGEPDTSSRTTSQSLLDLREDRDLKSKLSSISRKVLVSVTFETCEISLERRTGQFVQQTHPCGASEGHA